MAEPTTATTSTPKQKPKPIVTTPAFETPKFDMPKFEMPKFEIPKVEFPAAYREFAEKAIAQARENYEKMKSAAEEATETLEETYSTASKGCSGYGLKLVENARTNSNAAFDLLTALLKAKSYSEVVELATAYVRAQFDAVTKQAKELAEHAQKVATETAEPMKESFSNVFSKAA